MVWDGFEIQAKGQVSPEKQVEYLMQVVKVKENKIATLESEIATLTIKSELREDRQSKQINALESVMNDLKSRNKPLNGARPNWWKRTFGKKNQLRPYIFAIALILFVGTQSFAKGGFGGSRGGGFSSSRSSFSSSRSSSFGGSRASSRPATISRPSYSGSYGSAARSNNTTIIHSNSGGGGFWNGMFWGSMMNRPVVVANGGTVMGPGETVIVEQHGFFYYLCWTIFWIAMAFLVVTMVSAVLV